MSGTARQKALWRRAYLGFGANLGNKDANCRAGLGLLAASPGVFLSAVSGFYNTAPMHIEDQDWFVNGAARIETRLLPKELLGLLKDIEKAVGRKPNGLRYGPRVLDMDILIFEGVITEDEGLVLPHPRMHERRFVLAPLCDIGCLEVHPVLGQTFGELLDSLDPFEQKVVSR
ncbi:MAG: 2-amino-4-hydroxy-6-hydroxymethyldihydropteridine diphosphokinase [Desulfatibacillaceae bacterium]|nr:2-amino-4-hydroxy-6-hydroxymethyldihydropteridine diphosphokinase [Desulfatibacillaceae bacterium]